jgi:hypothetical protein
MSAIAIVGQSGTGKTTSITNTPEMEIEGLDPKETVVINVAGKDLPFRGWKKKYTGMLSEGGNYLETSNSDSIAKAIDYIKNSRPDIKNIVIDDGQYTMAFEFMARAKENGYGKFADIGVNMGKIVKAAKDAGSELKVYFLWHPEKDAETTLKMKTVGKMVDDYLTLEGLFTVILYTKVSKVDTKMVYQFVTNNDGYYPAKSPIGMFSELYIPNDLGKVARAIDTYNNGDDE